MAKLGVLAWMTKPFDEVNVLPVFGGILNGTLEPKRKTKGNIIRTHFKISNF